MKKISKGLGRAISAIALAAVPLASFASPATAGTGKLVHESGGSCTVVLGAVDQYGRTHLVINAAGLPVSTSVFMGQIGVQSEILTTSSTGTIDNNTDLVYVKSPTTITIEQDVQTVNSKGVTSTQTLIWAQCKL